MSDIMNIPIPIATEAGGHISIAMGLLSHAVKAAVFKEASQLNKQTSEVVHNIDKSVPVGVKQQVSVGKLLYPVKELASTFRRYT